MKRYIMIMSCLLLAALTGCAVKKEKMPENLQISISDESERQEYKIISDYEVEVAEKSEEASARKPDIGEEIPEPEEKPAIDYDYLVSMGYDILEENIAIVAGNVREHSLLKEYLKEDIEFDEDFCQRFGSMPSDMEYFLYDMNQDGVEDYFVCYCGVPWVGSAGNHLSIYIQEKDTLRMVFSVHVKFHLIEDDHAPIAILNDSNEGYYSFVLPYTNNRVWKYEKGKYYSE